MYTCSPGLNPGFSGWGAGRWGGRGVVGAPIYDLAKLHEMKEVGPKGDMSLALSPGFANAWVSWVFDQQAGKNRVRLRSSYVENGTFNEDVDGGVSCAGVEPEVAALVVAGVGVHHPGDRQLAVVQHSSAAAPTGHHPRRLIRDRQSGRYRGILSLEK